MRPWLERMKGKAPREALKANGQGEEIASSDRGEGPSVEEQESFVKPRGLSEVGSAGDEDMIDVVCVHGLMGHPRTTWTKSTQKDRFFWPAHLIEDVPGVRVFTYGYDADPKNLWGHVNQNRLAEHAQGLLGDMARERERTDTEDRPILWIAHSLGGLLVEKALTIGDTSSTNDSHLKAVADNTKGLITLGTPHAGSDLAAWAEISSRLLRSLHVNIDIIKLLTTDSEVLRDTNNAFARFLETRKDREVQVDIQVFHETLPISNVGMVVSVASASIFGYPAEGIDGNHMNMTKFSSREERGYEQIIGTIRRWSKKYRDQAAKGEREVFQACLNSLAYDELRAEYDLSQLRLGNTSPEFCHPSTTAQKGTFDWVFSNEELGFATWLLEPRGPYWIRGSPGSGKSTLVRHIVSSPRLLETLKPTKIVRAAHYFQLGSSDLARSIKGMLQSLLWQLLRQVEKAATRTVLCRYKDMLAKSRQTWLLSELNDSLVETATWSPDAAICFFVDGLDEHIGKDVELADCLTELQGLLPANVRLCLSSRPYPDFAAEFTESRGFRMQDQTSDDIRHYVIHRCEDLKRYLPQRVYELSKQIIRSAQGSFLWTRLVCDDLQSKWRRYQSFDALMDRLKMTPKEMQPFYQRILTELDEDELQDLNEVLSIVTENPYSLTSMEICYAMNHKRNVLSLEHARLGRWTSFDKFTRTATSDANTIELPVDWIQLTSRQKIDPDCYMPDDNWQHYGSTTESPYQRISSLCNDKVELIGRGFLVVNPKNGKVSMAHETMLTFWRNSIDAATKDRAHELMLIACASSMAAMSRRNPKILGTPRWWPRHYGMVATRTQNGDHFFQHVFERLVLRNPLHRNQSTISGLSIHTSEIRWGGEYLAYHSAGLVHYVRMIDSNASVISARTLHYLSGPPLQFWLSMTAARGEGALIERASELISVLSFSILAECHRSACAILDSVIQARTTRVTDASDIDVNDREASLLWMVSRYGNADLVERLFCLGAEVGKQLPLASRAIHRAVECNNMIFVQRFTQIYTGVQPVSQLELQRILNKLRRGLDASRQTGNPNTEEIGSNDAVAEDADWDAMASRDSFLDAVWVPKAISLKLLERRLLRDQDDLLRDQNIMCSELGIYTTSVKERSPLVYACLWRRTDIVVTLLQTYPMWESLLETSGSTLVEAAFCGKLNLLGTLLQLYERRHKEIPSNRMQEDLYSALLASIRQGYCDVLDVLLSAGAPVTPARDFSITITRLTLVGVSVVLWPLHYALHLFSDRDFEVSKRIVLSLAKHGAILHTQVKDSLFEWVDMGKLRDEDCVWLQQLFSANIAGPPGIVSLQVPDNDVEEVDSRFLLRDSDFDESPSDSEQPSSNGSVDGSSDSFMSAEESWRDQDS